MEFETIEPNVWKESKVDDQISGKLIAKKVGIGPNASNMYHIETSEGIKSVWGSTVLDDRMDLVKEGDYIRITFKGTQKNKRNQDTKIFKVERGKQ